MNINSVNFVPSEPILARLDALDSKLDSLLESPELSSAFLPLGKLATFFGINRKLARTLAADASSAGRLQILRPQLSNGTKCNPLYSVADFKSYLASK